MSAAGVMVAADAKQQWLLPWWWEHYRMHNDLPVVFVDLGMDLPYRLWCQEMGQVLSLPKRSFPASFTWKGSKELRGSLWVEGWNRSCQNKMDYFLSARNQWMQKPFAFLLSPFHKTIWIDLDCEVLGNVEELISLVQGEVELAASLSVLNNQESKVFSSGVVVFQKESSLVQKWALLVEQEGEHYVGDECALSAICLEQRKKVAVLPPALHWDWTRGIPWLEKDPLVPKIVHWGGLAGKYAIARGHTMKGCCSKTLRKEERMALLEPFCQSDPDLLSWVKKDPWKEYGITPSWDGFLYYVERASQDLIKWHLCKGGWEPHIHEAMVTYVKEGTVALDIGAHIGIHTLALSHLVGEFGSVYAFEPQRSLFCEHVLNMHINERKNVACHRCALGDVYRCIEMDRANPYNLGATRIGQGGDQAIMRPLDDFHLENVSLIKMDVEGSESLVIEGAQKTLKQNRPVWIIEVLDTPDREAFFQKMEDLEYERIHLAVHDYLFVPKKRCV